MSDLTIIFITVIICLELDFFGILFCNEISEYLHAKADQIRTKTAMLKEKHNTVTDERDTEVFRKE